MAKILQVLGTSSNSGKSTVAMALCRYFSSMGYSVAPFKSVNMSLNSITTGDGGEISRSVWLQAKAARTEPESQMNPFLLKPEGMGRSQVIINGKSRGTFTVAEYRELMQKTAADTITSDLRYLSGKYDMIIVEGAGSPAEINLMEHDYANTFVSEIYGTPALLVADIERGGVFASIYGTLKLMRSSELVRWVAINKMSGDFSILDTGIRKIEQITGKNFIGVIPMIKNFHLPGEDSLDYSVDSTAKGNIAVVRYPFMENYSDIDPLTTYGTGFFYVTSDNVDMLEKAEAIILPGSKSVPDDLRFIREHGIDRQLLKAASEGRKILGICGGYQILGGTIRRVDSSTGRVSEIGGLGLLNVSTAYSETKTTAEVEGSFIEAVTGFGSGFRGYEIHYGNVSNNGERSPIRISNGRLEGAISASGNVIGTNVHGLLENLDFMNFLAGRDAAVRSYSELLEENIEFVSKKISSSLDMEKIETFMGSGRKQ